MRIIELTELQFKNYSNIHSKKNYKQSIEYATLKQDNGYRVLYLGLIDDDDNVHVACLLLEKRTNSKFKYGIVPNGFLIDYNNTDLLKLFTDELKKYLKSLNYIFLRINALYDYQVLSNSFSVKENNTGIINTFRDLDYNLIDNSSKYRVVINSNNISDTYKNFKRGFRRDINECLKKGISIYQGDDEDLNNFIDLIDNKKYFTNMYNLFKTNNKFEIYFAKLNPDIYVNNYRFLLKNEQSNNDNLNNMLKNPNVKKTDNLLNKKMTSDNLITLYSNEIIKATNIYRDYPEGVILGTVGIVNNRKDITFLVEGFNPKFSEIKVSPLIKWEIIKKYMSIGYNSFILGNINISKDYNLKLGYNGDVVEYQNTFDLVINEMLYKLNNYSKKDI